MKMSKKGERSAKKENFLNFFKSALLKFQAFNFTSTTLTKAKPRV